MDSDEDPLFPIEPYDCNVNQIYQYNDPLSVSGVLRAVVNEDLEMIEHLLKSGKSVNINDNNGNTPLHVAVLKKNLIILKRLLAEEDIVVNTRNHSGQTPLFIAAKTGSFELANCLVNNGADVNLSCNGDITPLHVSIKLPNIAHLLITNGADIDTIDYGDDTPLHEAVEHSQLETVCMLLFYNADANIRGGSDLTPFMKALLCKNHCLQDILFEYVNDFNISSDEGSTLCLALDHASRYVEEIINRGAKVDKSAFESCLEVPNRENFKLVWRKLSAEEAVHISLFELAGLLDDDENHFQAYLDIILEDTDSSVLAVLAANLKSHDMALLVKKYAQCELDLDKLTKLICLMLQHGFQMSSFVIYEVFNNYGYCELFRLLLFMDYVSEWTSLMITSKLIFDIQTTVRTQWFEMVLDTDDTCICLQRLKKDVRSSFRYWIYGPLIEECGLLISERSDDFGNDEIFELFKVLPKIPSLLQLARDQTREYIVKRLNFSTTCQYYTFVNHLNISPVYRKILMFEKTVYDI